MRYHFSYMRFRLPFGRSSLLLVSALSILSLSFGVERDAKAQVHLGSLHRQTPRAVERLLSPRMNASKPPRLIVRNSHASASVHKLAVGSKFSLVKPTQVSDLSRLVWAPPKRLLMDDTLKWVDFEAFQERVTELLPDDATAGTGEGVVIGIVDGGLDFTHPDFRNDDGSTRVAWFLDFTTLPIGLYPDLEEYYGCNDPEAPCAILSSFEIDDLLVSGQTFGLSDDSLGHGTHVASLAAGGGKADPKYRGIAPEATLIAARVSDSASEVQDGDVLLATEFVFSRAAELGMPAVVNLSLGGDFGPHDGSTILEAALGDFLDEPGRAIVVAAGNSGETVRSGSLIGGGGSLGIHAQVGVADKGRATIVIPSDRRSYNGVILAWVDTLPGEELAVGISKVIEPVPYGFAAEGETRSWDALVSNGAVIEEPGFEDFQQGAFILLNGTFTAGEKINITLEGKGSADLWIQSSGDLGFGGGNVGALLEQARKGGTVSVPATSTDLIAVGATLNRTSWPSRQEGQADLAVFSAEMDDTPGSVAFFSSLGPNQLGALKPDILAPGMMVIGAMASTADPQPGAGLQNRSSMFGNAPVCESDPMCSVVSDRYGIAMGTSMASPVVAGAVALLLQVDPGLTQSQILNLLRAGASQQPVSKKTPKNETALPAAPGLLNIARSFDALELLQEATATPTDKSWLSLADVLIRPNAELVGLFRARDANGNLADVPVAELKLNVENADVKRRLARLAPGLYEFVLRGHDERKTKEIRIQVSWGNEVLAEAQLAHAPDLQTVRQSSSGAGSGGGGGDDGCAVAPGFRPESNHALHVVVLGMLIWAGRRRGKMTRGAWKPLN